MNITYYDEIITKANARKDALMAFEKACHDLRAQLLASAQLMNALYMIEQTSKKLDPETHALLPPDAHHALNSWVYSMLSAWRSISTQGSYCKMTPSKALGLFTGEPS